MNRHAPGYSFGRENPEVRSAGPRGDARKIPILTVAFNFWRIHEYHPRPGRDLMISTWTLLCEHMIRTRDKLEGFHNIYFLIL